jgi:hypothetical protein
VETDQPWFERSSIQASQDFPDDDAPFSRSDLEVDVAQEVHAKDAVDAMPEGSHVPRASESRSLRA